MRRQAGWLIGLLLAGTTEASALEQTYETWAKLALRPQGHRPLGFFLEVETQSLRNEDPGLEHLLLRAGLHVHSAPWSFVVGPAWTPTVNPQYRNEVRLWEQAQLLLVTDDERTLLLPRLRFEQRWIAYAPAVAYRLTPRMRGFQGIGNKPRDPGAWSITAYTELSINLNTVAGAVDSGANDAEGFVGPSWQAAEFMRVEAGYLAEYEWKSTGNNELVHVVRFEVDFAY